MVDAPGSIEFAPTIAIRALQKGVAGSVLPPFIGSYCEDPVPRSCALEVAVLDPAFAFIQVPTTTPLPQRFPDAVIDFAIRLLRDDVPMVVRPPVAGTSSLPGTADRCGRIHGGIQAQASNDGGMLSGCVEEVQCGERTVGL
jgi:hypothetical protein